MLPFHVVLGIEPGTLCLLGEHSTSQAISVFTGMGPPGFHSKVTLSSGSSRWIGDMLALWGSWGSLSRKVM